MWAFRVWIGACPGCSPRSWASNFALGLHKSATMNLSVEPSQSIHPQLNSPFLSVTLITNETRLPQKCNPSRPRWWLHVLKVSTSFDFPPGRWIGIILMEALKPHAFILITRLTVKVSLLRATTLLLHAVQPLVQTPALPPSQIRPLFPRPCSRVCKAFSHCPQGCYSFITFWSEAALLSSPCRPQS